MKKVDRGRTPWIVVLIHAPWYNSNTAHQGESESVDMKAAMEGLIYQARVDVVFAGHVHAYERFVSSSSYIHYHFNLLITSLNNNNGSVLVHVIRLVFTMIKLTVAGRCI